jgi:hypothetical protein
MYKPFYGCRWPFLHIKYCSWCAADFGIKDLLLSEPDKQPPKTKDPTDPTPLVLSFSLWQIVLGGVAQRWQSCSAFYHHVAYTTVTTQIYPFDDRNPNISIWWSQPKYIHLATPPNSPFGHGTSCMPKNTPTKRKKGTPKIKQMWHNQERVSLFLFMVCVCVCVCFVQILKLFNI